MTTWTIYKHTNMINGKVYVGQTMQPLKKRWKRSSYKYCPKLWNAIQKYGWENFSHDIITLVSTVEEALAEETHQIELHNSIDNGYNIIADGSKNQMIGRKHTPEAKLKQSQNNARYWKGKNLSDKTKAKIADGKRGQKCHTTPHSEESKAKMSKAFKGKTWKVIDGKRVWMENVH